MVFLRCVTCEVKTEAMLKEWNAAGDRHCGVDK